MPTSTKMLAMAWGATVTAGTLYYTVYSPTGAVLSARSNVGVVETPAGSGIYVAQATWDDATDAIDVWDNGATYKMGRFYDRRIASIFSQTLLIAADTGEAPSSFAPIGDAVNAETSVRFDKNFTGLGFDATGWTVFTFAIKRDVDADDDTDTLLLIRVTNPAAASDGILLWRGTAETSGGAMALSGSLTVTLDGANTTVRVQIEALAMVLPPSESSAPYTYEMDCWVGATKKSQFAKGNFNLARSVRRNPAAP